MNEQEAKKLENKVIKILKKYITMDDTVIIAVSGGSDSVFLLSLLKKVPCKFVVAHVNHMLRGKASDLDEAFVERISSPGKFSSKKVDITKLSSKEKRGIEETGRKIRYAFFKQLAKKHQAKYIITAHQADENIETIVFNFARGASLQGLCGIQQVEFFYENVVLLRPLIYLSKRQILDYLDFHKITYRSDKSNEDTHYKRNYIRKEVIPKLKRLNSSLTETVSQNINNLEEINDYLKEMANEWLLENTLNSDFSKLNAKSFRQQHTALKKMILIEGYKKIVGNTTHLEGIHLEEVIKIIDQNVGNKAKKMGKLKISLKHQTILIETA